MAKITIDQLRSLPDFAQMTKWDVTFLTLPAIGPLALLASERLNLQCESVELPKASNQKFEVMIRGHKTLHSGIMDYGNSMSFTFVETVDNTVMKLIKGWRELCWSSRQGASFPKKDLEATILITAYDNQDKPRAKWTVYGCFFESDDMGQMDSSSSDAIRPNLTISFDFFVDTPLV